MTITKNNVAAQAGDSPTRDMRNGAGELVAIARHSCEPGIAAQAGDEPIRAAFEAWLIAEAQRQNPVEPLTDKEKAFVLRRNVWDKTSYEAHDGEWQGWKAAHAAQVSPRATADVERDAAHFGLFLQMLDKAHVKFSKGKDNAINRVVFTLMVGNETTDTFRGKVRDIFDQLAAIATTKPGA